MPKALTLSTPTQVDDAWNALVAQADQLETDLKTLEDEQGNKAQREALLKAIEQLRSSLRIFYAEHAEIFPRLRQNYHDRKLKKKADKDYYKSLRALLTPSSVKGNFDPYRPYTASIPDLEAYIASSFRWLKMVEHQQRKKAPTKLSRQQKDSRPLVLYRKGGSKKKDGTLRDDRQIKCLLDDDRKIRLFKAKEEKWKPIIKEAKLKKYLGPGKTYSFDENGISQFQIDIEKEQDLDVFNDPIEKQALGLTFLNIGAGQTWDFHNGLWRKWIPKYQLNVWCPDENAWYSFKSNKQKFGEAQELTAFKQEKGERKWSMLSDYKYHIDDCKTYTEGPNKKETFRVRFSTEPGEAPFHLEVIKKKRATKTKKRPAFTIGERPPITSPGEQPDRQAHKEAPSRRGEDSPPRAPSRRSEDSPPRAPSPKSSTERSEGETPVMQMPVMMQAPVMMQMPVMMQAPQQPVMQQMPSIQQVPAATEKAQRQHALSDTLRIGVIEDDLKRVHKKLNEANVGLALQDINTYITDLVRDVFLKDAISLDVSLTYEDYRKLSAWREALDKIKDDLTKWDLTLKGLTPELSHLQDQFKDHPYPPATLAPLTQQLSNFDTSIAQLLARIAKLEESLAQQSQANTSRVYRDRFPLTQEGEAPPAKRPLPTNDTVYNHKTEEGVVFHSKQEEVFFNDEDIAPHKNNALKQAGIKAAMQYIEQWDGETTIDIKIGSHITEQRSQCEMMAFYAKETLLQLGVPKEIIHEPAYQCFKPAGEYESTINGIIRQEKIVPASLAKSQLTTRLSEAPNNEEFKLRVSLTI